MRLNENLLPIPMPPDVARTDPDTGLATPATIEHDAALWDWLVRAVKELADKMTTNAVVARGPIASGSTIPASIDVTAGSSIQIDFWSSEYDASDVTVYPGAVPSHARTYVISADFDGSGLVSVDSYTAFDAEIANDAAGTRTYAAMPLSGQTIIGPVLTDQTVDVTLSNPTSGTYYLILRLTELRG
jgi:hypothetical protein